MTAEQLAARLNAKKSGRQWKVCCVAHEDRSPSMLIFDGRDEVQVRCMAGCSPGDIIAALKARGLWEGGERLINAPKPPPKSVAPDHRDQARRIWQQTGPIGNMAARYFEGRDLLDVAADCPDIRHHPACPRGSDLVPAIVVAMRDVKTFELQAVQRIFLGTAGFGTVVKDGTPMMLGPAGGCAMMLHKVIGRRTLHIAEGLESALAVAAMDHHPVWALGSTSGIATLPVIDGVDELVIWADHDPINPRTGKRPGEDAAMLCAKRWNGMGRKVVMWMPKVEGWDANDVWSDRLARQ